MRSTFLKPFNIFNILSEVTVKDEADELEKLVMIKNLQMDL